MRVNNPKEVKEENYNMSEESEDKISSSENPHEKEIANETNNGLESRKNQTPDLQEDSVANGITEGQPETSETREVESTESEDTPPEVKPEEQLEQAQQQVEALQDRLLRMNAEFENYKRRIAKENAERFKFYHMGLVKELLPALDSLERAIEHGQKENTTTQAMLEGIQMVYKLNQEALEKFSVSKIEAIGEPFDPAVHQAVGTVESNTVPENHVVDQFQIGYLLHKRVIRPAMVRVCQKNNNE